VYGDGHGRPDSLKIWYGAKGGDASFNGANPLQLPDSVTFTWPTLTGGKTVTVPKSAISIKGDLILLVSFASVKSTLPTGFTSVENNGQGLAKTHTFKDGKDVVEEVFNVLDGIGPILANNDDAGKNPRIIENLNPGVAPDTLIIKLSEQPRKISGEDLVGNNTLFYVPKSTNPSNDPASGGTELTVLEASLEDPTTNAYKIVVKAISGGLQEGDWIRLNPAGPLADRGAYAADTVGGFKHADNSCHSERLLHRQPYDRQG